MARLRAIRPHLLPTRRPGRTASRMIAPGNLLWLGIGAGLAGGLVGGVLLGIGIALILNGALPG